MARSRNNDDNSATAVAGVGVILGAVLLNNRHRFMGFVDTSASPWTQLQSIASIPQIQGPPLKPSDLPPLPYHPDETTKKRQAQVKRQNERKKKHNKTKKHGTTDHDHVHTQIECPDDLSTLSCDANCYKNGKLWKIVCSAQERDELYPHFEMCPEQHGVPGVSPPPVNQDQYPEYHPDAVPVKEI